MKILLTGFTGYIAQRLLPSLVEAGHMVYCCIRDMERFHVDALYKDCTIPIQVDFLDKASLDNLPKDIDAAYYLIHSMSVSKVDFEELEDKSARNFVDYINQTQAQQVIYLSGIVNDNHLSKHLQSRFHVENILRSSKVPLTTLRAGIIIGSGSASFEIIRDLVEKLPVMFTPIWLNTKSQPIAIRDVIQYLKGVLFFSYAYNKSFDIGGRNTLSYKEMLLQFAEVRGLKRRIIVIPVMTPKLSSYWLYFITSTTYSLAKNLVDSMKVEVIGRPSNLAEILNIELISYKKAVALAFDKIEQNQVVSSWTDALSSDILSEGIAAHIQVPVKGCFIDQRKLKLQDTLNAMQNIWHIGGKRGWYYADWLWRIRGFIDALVGGVGLRRARKNLEEIYAGEALDFWRVLYADKNKKRLLLYAEMKLPGEAWLEFKITDNNELVQTAVFRPLGVWGRLYWYSVLPFHAYIFNGMIHNIAFRKYLTSK